MRAMPEVLPSAPPVRQARCNLLKVRQLNWLENCHLVGHLAVGSTMLQMGKSWAIRAERCRRIEVAVGQ